MKSLKFESIIWWTRQEYIGILGMWFSILLHYQSKDLHEIAWCHFKAEEEQKADQKSLKKLFTFCFCFLESD